MCDITKGLTLVWCLAHTICPGVYNVRHVWLHRHSYYVLFKTPKRLWKFEFVKPCQYRVHYYFLRSRNTCQFRHAFVDTSYPTSFVRRFLSSGKCPNALIGWDKMWIMCSTSYAFVKKIDLRGIIVCSITLFVWIDHS